jgi:hypothetical protein
LRLREIGRKEQEARWAEAERRRLEMEHQQRLEQERRSQLDLIAASWMKSQHLKQFLQECEESLSKKATNSDSAETRWLTWARSYAEKLDPCKNGKLQLVIQHSVNIGAEAEWQ